AVSLDATPSAGETVEHSGNLYTSIKEGLAHILVPKASTEPKSDDDASGGEQRGRGKGRPVGERKSVFYNPSQQFNRDLSVLGIRAFGEDRMASRPAKRLVEDEEGTQQKGRRKKRKTENGGVKGAADQEISEAGEPAEGGDGAVLT